MRLHCEWFFFGVTTTQDCGPESALDMVQFCWDYAERFNSIKYAVVLLPKFCYRLPFGYCMPRLICLRYFRALSDGWRDELSCLSCISEYRRLLRPHVNCQRPAECRCALCVRQPPSLRDAASHVLFRHTSNIQHMFCLSSNTSFYEYVYAARSGRVNIERLLPSSFPLITLWFASNTVLSLSHHLTCPGRGVWDTRMRTQIRGQDAAVRVLCNWSDRFWCMHCSRGLFFPPSCPEHPWGCHVAM